MNSTEQSNVEAARRYLDALEQRVTGRALATLFHPDVLYEEFPNRVVPNGARCTLADMLAASERGAHVLSTQHFEIVNTIASGPFVVLEVRWTGTLAVPYGTLEPGSEMRARVAMVIEFVDGRVIRQRNYDCYDPW
jgi:ketosteroid isomerase-like protein